MKKSVYRNQSFGQGFNIDLEIMLDLNRELTENDERSISKFSEKIISSLHEESINLNPQTHIDRYNERNQIVSLFGNRAIFVEEIPNGYGDTYHYKFQPWFVVTTSKGRIKIGWRKRVIKIDWEGSAIDYNAEFLFHSEDVTKYDKMIHAWSLDKAKEYIDVLLNT